MIVMMDGLSRIALNRSYEKPGMARPGGARPNAECSVFTFYFFPP
jgi:hypothetical protein